MILLNAFAGLGCLVSMFLVGGAVFTYAALTTEAGRLLAQRLLARKEAEPPESDSLPLSRTVPDDLNSAGAKMIGLPHGLLTVGQGCRDSNVAGATYPSEECRRTRL